MAVKLSPIQVAALSEEMAEKFIQDNQRTINADIDVAMTFCLAVITACGAIYRANGVEHGHASAIAQAAINEVYSV
jgi:hypothetical protein